MNYLKKWRPFRLALGALMLAAGGSVAAAEGAKPGDRLPALEILGLSGKVPATQGKVVLVDFWASWCGPCKKSFPGLEALHQAYAARGLVLLGVNVDRKPEDMDKFLDAHKATFPIVQDTKHAFVSKVGVTAMPTSLIVDRKGVIRSIHSGFRGEETLKALRAEIEKLLEEKP